MPRDMRQENIDSHDNDPNSEAKTSHITGSKRLDEYNQGADLRKKGVVDKFRDLINGKDPYTGKPRK